MADAAFLTRMKEWRFEATCAVIAEKCSAEDAIALNKQAIKDGYHKKFAEYLKEKVKVEA